MNNKDAVERFDQAHSAKIDKLFWIAGSLENDDLKSLIEDDMEDRAYKKCFPSIFNSKSYNQYREDNEMMQAFVDFKVFGLFAEIHIPRAYNFSYDKKTGKPTSWSSSAGICRIEYVYAETIEELMIAIEEAATKVFNEYVSDEKKKAKAKA